MGQGNEEYAYGNLKLYCYTKYQTYSFYVGDQVEYYPFKNLFEIGQRCIGFS